MKSLIKLLAVVAVAGAVRADEAWVRFSDDGHRIIVEADGIQEFSGVSSAVYDLDGKNHRVGIKGYTVVEPVRETVGTTPFGEAVISKATYGNGDYQYTLTLKRLKNLRAFTVQAVLHNRSGKDIKFRNVDLFDLNKGAGGSLAVNDPSEWLVTPLMEASKAMPLSEMDSRLNEVALVRNQSDQGFLVGPVGPAEAYTALEVRGQSLKAEVQMDNVLVRAGESRRSEEMIFIFEPTQVSTDIWTRWVAITHGVRLNKGPVYGWCSWYDRTTKIDAEHVLDVTKTIKENPNTFGKGIIQIDDGYQKMDGDWSANDKFPMGMASVAKTIREAGCIPGVWFAPLMINPDHPWIEQHPDAIQTNAKGIASFMNANPFHPAGAKWVNPDHPETKKYLYNIIKDARDRGFGYIKIDFNGIGSRFVDPSKTRLQVFRDLYTLYRDAAGEDMYILSCLGQPTRGVIGFIDSARVGPDSHPAHFDHCLDSVLRFQIYDNVWWQNDPDVSYLEVKLPSRRVGYTPQGEGMWKTWHNINTLVGGTAMISEPINKQDVKEVWRNYEIMRPGSREPARLLTLGQSAENTVFGFSADRPFGDFAVYNLYNPSEETRALTLDFATAGLPSGVECAVYDFWQGRVIDYAKNSYTTEELEQHSSALLRFTPIIGDHPVLVGSDLHLSVGATEVDHIRILPKGIEIDLSDAGAQEGALTFYSKTPLTAAESENCEVDSVQNLGDHLWMVNVSKRLWGKEQKIALNYTETAGPVVVLSKTEKEKVSAHFLHLDRDGDGRVTQEEYVTTFVESYESQDVNGDGVLTAKEFGHPAFRDMDSNADGRATLEEFRSLYASQFSGIDKNRNGYIAPGEM